MYFYVLAFATITRGYPTPEFVRALLAQPCLFIIPFLLGKSLMLMFRRFLREPDVGLSVDALVAWVLGAIFMVVLESVLYVSYALDIYIFIIILLLICAPSILAANKPMDKSSAFYIAAAGIYGLLFSIFITLFWGYPYANANDYVRHTYYALRIVEEGRPLLFYSSYLPTMHTLYAVLMALSDIREEPLFLLWSSRFVLYPVHAAVLFLFFRTMLDDETMALMASMIGSSLMNNRESHIFPWHTAPKCFITILFIYALHALYIMASRNRDRLTLGVQARLYGLCGTVFVLTYLTYSEGIIGYHIGYIFPLVVIITIIASLMSKAEVRSTVLYSAFLIEGLIFFHKFEGLYASIICLASLSLWAKGGLGSTRKHKALNLLLATSLASVALALHTGLWDYPPKSLIWPFPQKPSLRPWDTYSKSIVDVFPSVVLLMFYIGFALSTIENNAKLLYLNTMGLSLLLFYILQPLDLYLRFLKFPYPFIIASAIYPCFRLFHVVKIPRSTIAVHGLQRILPFSLVLGMSLYICLHDIGILEHPYVIDLQDRFFVFEIGSFLKEYSKGKDLLVISTIGGRYWYYEVSTFYADVQGMYNMWKEGKVYYQPLWDIYLANTSEEAYTKIMSLSRRAELIVHAPDPYGEDIRRFYREPEDIILLYDDYLARWVNDTALITPAKFFDLRYFTPLLMLTDANGMRFYVIRVNPEPKALSAENLIRRESFEIGSIPIFSLMSTIVDVEHKKIYVIGTNQEINTTARVESFEEWDEQASAPVSWTPSYVYWGGNWTASLDSIERVDGNYSLKLESYTETEHTRCGSVFKDFDVRPGEVYLLRFWMKTFNADRSHVKVVYIDPLENEWRCLSLAVCPDPTSPWRSYYKILQVPENITSVRIVLLAGNIYNTTIGYTATWFDRLELIGPVLFEETPWIPLYAYWGGNWSASLDSRERVSGNYSLKLETRAEIEHARCGSIALDFDVIADKLYLLKFWVKTENADRSHVRVVFLNTTDNTWNSITYVVHPHHTSGWTVYYKLIHIPKNITSIRIVLLAGNIYDTTEMYAATWFDDVELMGPIKVNTTPPRVLRIEFDGDHLTRWAFFTILNIYVLLPPGYSILKLERREAPYKNKYPRMGDEID